MKIGAFDTEHSANLFRPWEPNFYVSCIGAVDTTGFKKIWWLDHNRLEPQDHRKVLDEFQEWLNTLDYIAAHNLKHDLIIMRYQGVDFEKPSLWCTMVAEYLLSGQDVVNRQFGLSDVAQHYGMQPKLDVVRTQYWDCGIDTCDVPPDILGVYCLDDTQKALEICVKQQYHAKEEGKWQLIKLHNEFTKSLSDMELHGFRWNLTKSKEIYEKYIRKVTEIEEDLYKIAGERRLNFGSPAQLSAFLYGGKCKVNWKEWVYKEVKKDRATRYYEKKFEELVSFPAIFRDPRRGKKRNEGSAPTDKRTLLALPARTAKQIEVRELLIKRSKAQKVAETLIGKRTESGLNNKVQPDGRIHPKLNQTVARTGRLSSSDPNGQNLPRGSTSPIKTCIEPVYEWHCQYDLKQVEWKGAGELSGDIVMIGEVNDGVDQHSASCVNLMELPLNKDNRQNAKVFNFRMIFGGTPYGYHKDPAMPKFGLPKWERTVSAFYRKYYGLADWHAENIKRVLRGETLRTFTGRTFVFNKTQWKDGIWQYNENEIKNYPVQGLAGGDLLPLVCSIVRRGMMAYHLKSKLFLTVHDSLGFDAITAEVPVIHSLCTEVGGNLHKYIKAYFGYTPKVVNWGGDFEVGKNYGELMKYEEWKATYM